MLGNLLLVAIGSAIGGVGRYAVGLLLPYDPTGPSLPIATLLVNLSGSLAIGLISGLAMPGGILASVPSLNLFMTAGILGGFTTFSAFSEQTAQMLAEGEPFLVVTYATMLVWGCVASAAIGLYLGTRI
jgi:CrcB protein